MEGRDRACAVKARNPGRCRAAMIAPHYEINARGDARTDPAMRATTAHFRRYAP